MNSAALHRQAPPPLFLSNGREPEGRAPVVSVVVSTFRRLARLQRCLDGLLAQDFDLRRCEVIVVDDGHDDAVRDRIDALGSMCRNGPVIWYPRPHAGRGPAVARNCGWRAARAALIAFTDDDTLPQPARPSEGVAAMAEHTGWFALCGRIDMLRLHPGSPTDHELMTIGLESAQFATVNAFVRRDALARIGGLDESFKRAWCESSDPHFRLMDRVGPVVECKGAVVSRSGCSWGSRGCATRRSRRRMLSRCW